MNKKIILTRMLKSKFFMVGLVTALLIIFATVFAPYIIKYNPEKSSLGEILIKPGWFGSEHFMGTDQLGRDILSRVLIGGRHSFFIAVVVVCCACFLGTALGIISGYMGKAADNFIMRMCDVFLSIPNMILAIAVMAILGASTINLIIVLVVTGWVQYCKVTRNNVLIIKNMEFVKASKALGASKLHIMVRQIFPNVTTQLIILFTFHIGEAIMCEAALSFLNLGIQPPAPSWGNMITDGREYLATNPWLTLAPGIALMITVLAFNFLGDGLRDVLDTKGI